MTENNKPTVGEIINAGVRRGTSTGELANAIWSHYPEMSIDEMVKAFRDEAARNLAEADALEHFALEYFRQSRPRNDNEPPPAA